ncbi:hypothetical protein PsYK624_074600 [Phanerochaete sordida]|uniref:TPR-like protein n=1 Tax=Phanerochaete sordida TaxID=48140 RepID=A0A9P3GAI3_9APHY|nr:hypothetical protein PsYK624_074600 [Phanerochaete sordida]
MSHSHSHAPGQPSHSHGPPPPNMQQQQQQQQQKAVMPPADPVMQAVIEASFIPVDIALGPPENVAALCEEHKRDKCTECDVDFSNLNRISWLLHMNPNLRCPPPPQMVTQKLSQAVTQVKEEGNTLFKTGQHPQAIARYAMALQIASQRPPWEASALARDEYSTVLSNRSAAYYEAGDYINALVDAEAVIQVKKPWSKGYFRKAKALLQLHSYQEAKETLELGLSFEAENQEMLSLLAVAEGHLRSSDEKAVSRVSS